MKKLLWGIGCFLLVTALLYLRPLLFSNHTISFTDDPHDFRLAVVDPNVFPSKNKPLELPIYHWPPFNIHNADGSWSGADVEITEAILNRMGYEVEWVELPFARALEEMKSANFPAMAPCVIGGGREEFVYFSEPVSTIYSVLWKKASNLFSWTTYQDLKGKNIGASYYHYGADFVETAETGLFTLDKVAAKSPEIVHFRKLLEGKTDLFICEVSVGKYIRSEHSPEFDQVDFCNTGVGPARPFCFAVSRKYFEGREKEMKQFIESFNEELIRFSMSGERQRIFNKYNMPITVGDDGQILISLEGEQ